MNPPIVGQRTVLGASCPVRDPRFATQLFIGQVVGPQASQPLKRPESCARRRGISDGLTSMVAIRDGEHNTQEPDTGSGWSILQRWEEIAQTEVCN